MGYTKQWISPAIPSSNNAADWKAICQDIHNNMITAGMVWVDVTGEMKNFDTYPSDMSYGGYRVYRVNDALAQAGNHIYIRIDFGTGPINLYTDEYYLVPRTPRFQVQIGTSVDSEGTIGALSSEIVYALPHTFMNSVTGIAAQSANTPGSCFITVNHELGFFGFVHGMSAQRASHLTNFYGCNMLFLIQRDLDDNMVPTNKGFTVVYPNSNLSIPNLMSTGYLRGAFTSYVSYDGGVITSDRGQYLPFSDQIIAAEDGSIQVSPCLTMTPTRKQLPSLNAYPVASLGEGMQYKVQVSPTKNLNFVSLGPNNCCLPCNAYNLPTQVGAFGMLFE